MPEVLTTELGAETYRVRASNCFVITVFIVFTFVCSNIGYDKRHFSPKALPWLKWGLVLLYTFLLWNRNSLHSCEQMLEIWATLYNYFLHDIPQMSNAQDFSRWPCYLQLLYSTAPCWVSSCHSDVDKYWQASRLPLGISGQHNCLWGLRVGFRLLVTSQSGAFLEASHSPKSKNWHNGTKYLSLTTTQSSQRSKLSN